MMMRLWQAERPAAVLVGWDSLETPTYRHQAYEPYQSGRVFEESLLEQLALLPAVCEKLGFLVAQGAGVRGGRLPRRGCARRGRARARRDVGPRRVSARERPGHHPRADARRQRARTDRPRGGARALRRRSRAGARPDRAPRRPVRQAAGRARDRPEEGGRDPAASTARSRTCSRPAASRRRRRTCASTGELPRWTPPLPFLPSRTRHPTGRRRLPTSGSSGSAASPTD